MSTWKVILATMVIFGTGVVTGGLLIHQTERYRAPHRQFAPSFSRQAMPISPGGVRLEFLRRMQRELGLTPEQKHQVDTILKQSQERSKKLMEPVTPHLREELKRVKAEFREVLTAEQQQTFDALAKQQQRPREPRRQAERTND